ncbi:MAG TPA: hypothetical protein VG055_33840 [Planctomycetaceae bacterium]|jgi:hypothetical protein|nr:hypothetical protein [Planctomycetaceae bacterium]
MARVTSRSLDLGGLALKVLLVLAVIFTVYAVPYLLIRWLAQ